MVVEWHLGKREHQRVVDTHFISVRQVSSDEDMLLRGTWGHAVQWPTRTRFNADAAADAAVYRQFDD